MLNMICSSDRSSSLIDELVSRGVHVSAWREVDHCGNKHA